MSTKRKVQLFAIVLILAVIGILTAQNSETTRLKLFAWEIETSRIILFTGLAFIGFLAGVLTGLLIRRQRKQKNGSDHLL